MNGSGIIRKHKNSLLYAWIVKLGTEVRFFRNKLGELQLILIIILKRKMLLRKAIVEIVF